MIELVVVTRRLGHKRLQTKSITVPSGQYSSDYLHLIGIYASFNSVCVTSIFHVEAQANGFDDFLLELMLILPEPDNTLICDRVPFLQRFELPLPCVIQSF